MILERSKNLTLVKEFMLQPEIFRQAAEDGASLDYEFTESEREIWLFAIENGVAIGAISVELENDTTAWFHPYILSSHKNEYLKLVKLFLDWFNLYFPVEVQKLNAYMPTYAKKAYKVALSAGFKDEGLNRMSYLKNGKLWDRHLVGIIRRDLNG